MPWYYRSKSENSPDEKKRSELARIDKNTWKSQPSPFVIVVHAASLTIVYLEVIANDQASKQPIQLK